MIGMEILKPKMVVVISILLTSIRIRGRKLFKHPKGIYTYQITSLVKTIEKVYCLKDRRKLTGSLQKRFCSLEESIRPMHQKHSSRIPS